MNKSLLILALAASMTITGANAQTTQKLTAGKANDYGLIYNLPLTSVRVVVEVQRSEKKPGEFYRYSRKYLSLDPVTAPSDTWTLAGVWISVEPVADPDESYLVQFKSGSAPFITVDGGNFPIAVNDDSYAPAPKAPVAQAKPAKPTILETPVAASAMTQEMLQSQSSAKRAELAANKIYELRQSRNDIISGQADQMPGDGAAMQLALDNLSRQEEALTAMFAGTEKISTEVEQLDWLVDLGEDTDSRRVIIGRLSAAEGIVPVDDLSGEPIYLDIKVRSRGELPANEKGEPKRFPKGGLAYRIPGEAEVQVVYQGRTVAKSVIPVAQLGVVFGLDPSMFTDKKAPAYLHFDHSTGAVVELGTLK